MSDPGEAVPIKPCPLCGDKGGFEWNRHAHQWETAYCPECGRVTPPGATPPKMPYGGWPDEA